MQSCHHQSLGDSYITESEEYGCKEDKFGTVICYCNTNNCNKKLLVDNFIKEKQQGKVKSSEKCLKLFTHKKPKFRTRIMIAHQIILQI